jgi:hypothetical protein
MSHVMKWFIYCMMLDQLGKSYRGCKCTSMCRCAASLPLAVGVPVTCAVGVHVSIWQASSAMSDQRDAAFIPCVYIYKNVTASLRGRKAPKVGHRWHCNLDTTSQANACVFGGNFYIYILYI